MSKRDRLAITWAYGWVAIFAVFAIIGILTGSAPADWPWPQVIGAAAGLWAFGPLLWLTRRP